MQENNSKIALFTCHNDPNYGSMLQAFALAEAIRICGKRAEYISYIAAKAPHKGIVKALSNIKRHLLTFVGKNPPPSEFDFFKSREFRTTMQAYKRFHDTYIPCSAQIYYADTIKEKLNVSNYCIYMVGSDQLWSPNLYRPTKPYFLDVADFRNKRAYAPSFGTTEFTDEYKQLLKEKLKSFDYLSCRELVNSRMLSNLLGKEVKHVLDPTLLLTPNEWNKIATKPTIEGKYILAYILGEKEIIAEFAESLSKYKGIPVYYIVTRPKYLNKTNTLTGVGPDDFLGLVKDASYVVTDSYHGCLFSINYNVNFYAFGKRQGSVNTLDNVRIIEMLNMFGIHSRFIDDENSTGFLNDIDYSAVNSIVSDMRKESLEYLNKCVEL